MATETAKRDPNYQPVIQGVTDDANLYPTSLRVNPTTKRLETDTVISALSTIYNGTKTVPTGTAETIATTQATSGVIIKALSTNTVAVYIGNASLTVANGFELMAGESLALDIDDIASVYVISGSASQVIRYFAIT